MSEAQRMLDFLRKRELGIWKHHAREAQKKVTQLESAVRAKDARHLEKIEKLKAIIRNERSAKDAWLLKEIEMLKAIIKNEWGKHLEVVEKNELLQGMVQTLEQQLQQ